MTTPKPALPEPVALIDPRALARGDASLHCITRPEYRSIADADAGVEYVPVYTRAAIDAAVAEARAQMQERIDDQLRTIKALMVGMPDEGTTPVIRRIAWLEQQLAEARAVPEQVQLPYFNRREVERQVESSENPSPGTLRLNDSKERVTLPGGTLRRMLQIIDMLSATPSPTMPAVQRMRDDYKAFFGESLDDPPAMPVVQPDTVPWPQVTRYSGGASHEGIGGKVWIRLADDGPEVEYVPAEQPKPARVALSDEQINTIRKEHTTGSWIDSHSFARAVIAEYERVNGIAPAQGEQP